MNDKLNFLFCATRLKDVDTLKILFSSIEKYHDYNYQLVTRPHLLKHLTEFNVDNISLIDDEESATFLDKTYAIKHCSFDKFIYLDCDTFLLDAIFDLWLLIEKYNICVAHAPRRYTHEFKSVPNIFPEFNTGVIGVKRTNNVNSLIDNWHSTFFRHAQDENFPASKDQPFFRKCLYDSSLKFFTLTNEYNCRFRMGVNVCNNVKILHGYCENVLEIANKINSLDEYKTSSYSGEADVRCIKY